MKDYRKLEERIDKEKEITIGDINDLGYSRYDINQFIDSGILSRIKRGLYKYLPELQVVETPEILEQSSEGVVLTSREENEEIEERQVVDSEQLFQCVNQGIYNLIKRQNEQAIEMFNKALDLEPNNGRALIGLVGAYIFLNDYQKAYEYLVQFYNTRMDNSLLYNVYYYLLLLKEHVEMDDNLLSLVKEEIEANKDTVKKQNSNFKKLHRALDEEDYLDALKYINFSINIDIKGKKYHITNHIYKALIIATLRVKGIDPYVGIAKYREEKGLSFVRQDMPKDMVRVESIVADETQEEVIMVPATKAEETIKVNLLLEAINSNNYDLALSLLEQENVDNPLEVIRTLLTKLSMIKSLIVSKEPVKVVTVEPVRVVDEQSLLEDVTSTIIQNSVLDDNSSVLESMESIGIRDSSVVEDVPVVEPSINELIDLAYRAYKNAYHSEQFDEASKNLRRYEFLNNSHGRQRNVNFHRIRIEQSKRDFELDPERYVKKKALAKVIFDLKKERRYDATLAAIEEYKSLGGIKNELVTLVEAEIYFVLGNFGKTSVILNDIRSSEEPTYFILSSKVAFRNRRYHDALLFCQSFNERRPNYSPANYQLMGDCYTKLGKPGKAIKAYRKAEEIAAEQGSKRLDLTDKINKQELVAEFKKEERDARNLGKKK